MEVQRDLFTGEPIVKASKSRRSSRKLASAVRDRKTDCCNSKRIDELKEKIASLEDTIVQLRDFICSKQTVKESYTTIEVARILGKKPYTVREWCRLRRVNADKAMCGRGSEIEWRIRHDELARIQNEGLLPPLRR